VHGVTLHYKEVTAGAGLPGEALNLLLLHGFNGSEFNWRPVMAPLAARLSAARGTPVRAIAFDRPPFGLSERPLVWATPEDNPYTPAAAVRFSHGLLAALGVRTAAVFGHSAGSAVAVDLAIAHPEAISALVLAAPALQVDEKGFLARADLGQLLRFAATRALLATDGPGLWYVRRQIEKRREEVRAGRLGIYADEDEVRCCLGG